MIRKISIVVVIFFTILIFRNYPIVRDNIILSCELFLNRIFPSLFPMFIISSILINLNFILYINLIFKDFLAKLFKINANCGYIFLMSIISGCPSNAKIAKEMYDDGLISESDVQKIILFTHFANPLFIISMVKNYPYLVLLAHYLSNVIIGIIIRNKYPTSSIKASKVNKSVPLGEILTSAINSAMSTLMFILGTIVTFYIITSIINTPFTNLIMEMSQGLKYLETIALSIKAKTILAGCLLSFGGICIHFQVYGILNKLKVRYLPYLLCRLLHAFLTATILFIIIPK